jgi:hypothetical protein
MSTDTPLSTDLVSITGELAEAGRHGSDRSQVALVCNGCEVVRIFGLSDEQTKALAPHLFSTITLVIRHG